MRITFLAPFVHLSGGIRVVFELAADLSARGHNVTVVYPGRLESENFSKMGWLEKVLRFWKYRLFVDLLRLHEAKWFENYSRFKIIRRPTFENQYLPEADILVATGDWAAGWLLDCDNRKGRKFHLIQGYETWFRPEREVKKSWRLPIDKLVVSNYLYQIAKKLGQERRTEMIGPLGLDRSLLGVKRRPDKKIRILMLYHQSANKGLSAGISAVREVKKDHPEIELWMYGSIYYSEKEPNEGMKKSGLGFKPDGKNSIYYLDKSSMRALKKKSPLDRRSSRQENSIYYFEKELTNVLDRYILRPRPSQLASIYYFADIFLWPADNEGFGLPPFEAMAAGLAVVTTKSGAMPEIGLEGKTVLFVRPGDIGGMKAALSRLIEDRELRLRLGRAARRRVEAHTWPKFTDRFLKAISK